MVENQISKFTPKFFSKLRETLNILVLIPVGRGGSFFFQSLLDSHEEVMMFPDRYDFEYFKNEPISNFCDKNESFFNSDKSSFNIGNEFLELEEKYWFVKNF